MILNLIAAACDNMGIGCKGNLPWRLKKEMAFFTEKTMTTDMPGKKNAVIMGRKTWLSIPKKFRPLPNRINIVLSSTEKELNGADNVSSSFENALTWVKNTSDIDKVFIIGGESVYKAAMNYDCDQIIYLTQIRKDFECDAHFPSIDPEKYSLSSSEFDVPRGIQEENGIQYTHEVYVRKPTS